MAVPDKHRADGCLVRQGTEQDESAGIRVWEQLGSSDEELEEHWQAIDGDHELDAARHALVPSGSSRAISCLLETRVDKTRLQ